MMLSCSTLNAFYDCELSYLNKQMKLPAEDFPWFKSGRDVHQIIQKHISGEFLDERLMEKLEGFVFPIVETCDFDPKLKFKIKFGPDEFIGFLDARNDKEKVFSDIKTSKELWNLKKFVDLMQRKVYQLAFPDYRFVGITATPDLSEVYTIKIANRPQDAEVARKWIVKGFEDVKKSDFKATEDKSKCFRCVYRKSCQESGYEK